MIPSIVGFLLTGVGLPLLGILAIARTGGDLQTLTNRVGPVFGLVFTVVLYLVIGPLFAIPRTATVSYEIGIFPFLGDAASGTWLPLALWSLFFFAVTVLLSLNPTKLVDRIGKWLTPILLIVIGLLAVKSMVTPMGPVTQPIGEYAAEPFFRSFLEGYLTMDTLAALVFGIVVIQALRSKGVREPKEVLKAASFAGIVAAIGLSIVYFSLSYIGASSVEVIGHQDNGGAVLALSAGILYGEFGQVILALAITFACLTTSIGLVTSAAQYFNHILPRVSYVGYVLIFSGFSAFVSNIGLTQLIAFSLPVLLAIYPIAIVLILLSFAGDLFGHHPAVYKSALFLTGIIGIFDGLRAAGIEFGPADSLLGMLPLYEQGIGWFVPAIATAVVAALLVRIRPALTD